MRKKSVCLAMLFAITFIYCKAQNSPYTEVNIASPGAASLGKYADIPVSYHTGLPQISIPIYTIKEGPLTLPVSLSYHAGGVKVMEPASWVGTGFALNAGGLITRTVRGAPDEAANTGIGAYGHFSSYGFSNYLTNGGGGSDKSIYNAVPGDNNFALGVQDGEPDLFFFNFAGYSGKFYFNDDRTPVLVNGEDLKIEYYFPRDNGGSYTAVTANIQGFRITAPDGTKYYFGMMPGGGTAGANPVEMSFPYTAQQTSPSDRVYSSWYLRKIESADGIFTINLTYQSEFYSYYTLSMFPIDGTWMPKWNSWSNSEYKLVRNYIEGVRLSEISFSNGTVSFIPASTPRTDLAGNYSSTGFTEIENANTDAKALAAISINNNNGFCRQFNFLYSYFTDDAYPTSLQGYLANYAIQTDKTRLKLESLTEQTCDGSLTVNPYRFEYYSNFLPRMLSFAQDHWGYYNGATQNDMLIPTYSMNKFDIVDGANRDAKWPEMKHGALTKIVYPTGGSATFEFEPHTTWINTTRYSTSNFGYFSVGLDGSGKTEEFFHNKYFGGAAYMVKLNNSTCPVGQDPCGASVRLIDANNNSIYIVGTDGGTSVTKNFTVPAGYYTIHLVRAASTTETGKGAEAIFTEYVANNVQKNETVGGLRIRSITRNDDGSSPDIVTSYNYNESNGHSSGMLYSRPAYVQLLRNDVVAKFGFGAQSGNSTENVTPNGCMGPEMPGNNIQKYYKSPCPIFPMSTTQGNHIGYNEVKVTQAGNGSSVYRYYGSNIWDYKNDDVCYRNVNPTECLSSVPNSPAAPPSFEFKRGLLKYEGHFNEAGNILKDVQYYYDFDSTTFSTPCYLVKNLIGYMLGNQYVLRGYWKSKEETITTEHIPNTNRTITSTNSTYFESPWHHMATRNETVDSKGHTISKNVVYAQDFRIAGCDAISTGLSDYNSACSACDAAAVTRTNNCADYTCRYWAWIDNIICRANARKDYITTRRNNYTNSSNAFATCMANAKSTAGAPLKPILELRDIFNNAPIEITFRDNNKVTSTAFTNYDYATNPVKVYPVKVQTIPLQSSLSDFSPAVISNNALVKDSRYSNESSARFELGNLVDLTPRNGVNSSWLWDHQNNLPVAKVTGAGNNAIAYTSFEANGSGNWNISSTSRDNTQGITGSVCYNLSNGSISKAGLSPAVTYIVSYWTKNSSPLTINGTQGTPALLKESQGWRCYEHVVQGITDVMIQQTTGLIDELRLFPAGAEMETWCYVPLLGIINSCDKSNRIAYYEYDGLGRLTVVRDQDANIIKTFKYHYKQ